MNNLLLIRYFAINVRIYWNTMTTHIFFRNPKNMKCRHVVKNNLENIFMFMSYVDTDSSEKLLFT